MKKLVIAEKPSVAREIARTLGATNRGDGYSEGADYVVTWALGHLVELAEPAHYSDRYRRWSLTDLPMLPEKLDQVVIEDTKDQFDHIASLLSREDISSVVVATDAGREGELVARWILKLCDYSGPLQRLWISSQTEKAIKEGFANLKDGSAYDNLYKAASCRAAADWYVGMNVTRALTCFFDAKISAGRVQTPTLALMTNREDEIDAFMGNFYYTAKADFGLFSASYYPEENSIRFQGDERKSEMEALSGKEGAVVRMTTEQKEDKAPLAYDLTELQRDANIMLGYSAKETLDTLQKLYEVHKIVTYPRTDSRYITPDIVPTLRDRLAALSGTEFGTVSGAFLRDGYVVDNQRFVQEALVTDHHALLPTEQKVRLEALSATELGLWRLIALRFLEVLSPSYTYTTTTADIDVEGHIFRTRLTLPVNQGWKAVSAAVKERSAASLLDDVDSNFALLHMKEGDKVKIESIKVRQMSTTPPERYTDATLLSAMEHAGRFVDDKSLKANLGNGLGTPATRADMIEKLVQNNYVERQGKYFVPTPKGREVVRLAPDVLKSPELTGLWEGRLDAISRGKEDADLFVKDIKKMASDLVCQVSHSHLVFAPDFKGEGKLCPYCNGPMMKAIDAVGAVHYICQRLSCGYEEKEVKVKVDTGLAGAKKIPQRISIDGKVKVVIHKGAVKVPKAVYETKIEVVRESKKLRRDRPMQRSERHDRDDRRPSFSSGGTDALSGGSFADFMRQSEERKRRDEEKRKKK